MDLVTDCSSRTASVNVQFSIVSGQSTVPCLRSSSPTTRAPRSSGDGAEGERRDHLGAELLAVPELDVAAVAEGLPEPLLGLGEGAEPVRSISHAGHPGRWRRWRRGYRSVRRKPDFTVVAAPCMVFHAATKARS